MRIPRIIRKKLNQLLKYFKLNSVNYPKFFNLPVRYISGHWHISPKIFELPFIHHFIDLDGKGKRVLEFGCAKSYVALQLAVLGYEVVGIDLRKYILKHPNLTFHQTNLLNFEEEEKFDYIISISVLEHIGLKAYKQARNEFALKEICKKLSKLLKLDGKLIVTVPFGKKYEDDFMRSFTYEEISSLFDQGDLKLIYEEYFFRDNSNNWIRCDLDKAKT
ncbi:MAG: class I SAM-dependent methyltransferase, partial [Candidatus Thorarchaeota archaeon]